MADSLRLLNTKLVSEIQAMSDDELWQFLLSRLDEINAIGDKFKFKTWLFICLNKSFDLFKKRFWEEMEYVETGNDLFYTLILDFAFEGEKLKLDYYGIGGFYDNPESCNIPKSDEVMPEMSEDSNSYYHKIDFYLLGVPHLDKIIRALEDNAEKLTVNTPADIEKVKMMREKCANDENYKVAYIYCEDYY